MANEGGGQTRRQQEGELHAGIISTSWWDYGGMLRSDRPEFLLAEA